MAISGARRASTKPVRFHLKIDVSLRQELAYPRAETPSLRRQPDDHNFGSLIMLAVTAGAFLLVTWVATKGLFFFLQESPIR
jgi:hypothetical protein